MLAEVAVVLSVYSDSRVADGKIILNIISSIFHQSVYIVCIHMCVSL